MDIELVVPDFTNPCAAFGEPIEVVDEDDRLIVPAEVGARELGAEAKETPRRRKRPMKTPEPPPDPVAQAAAVETSTVKLLTLLSEKISTEAYSKSQCKALIFFLAYIVLAMGVLFLQFNVRARGRPLSSCAGAATGCRGGALSRAHGGAPLTSGARARARAFTTPRRA